MASTISAQYSRARGSSKVPWRYSCTGGGGRVADVSEVQLSQHQGIVKSALAVRCAVQTRWEGGREGEWVGQYSRASTSPKER